MKKLATGVLGLGLLLALPGCAHRHHHHHAEADPAALEKEHEDTKMVIVHDRPGPRRHCWKHRRHWHCRR